MSLDEQFAPGARIGSYEVLSKLGQGGMGGVFLVRQVFLGKRFALKVLKDELAALPEFAEIFRHEAQLLAALHHAHIVQIHDFGVTGDRHYFVMDYVEGGSLEELRRTRGGRLPPVEALSALRSVAAGLSHAHALGVVHRDLKPENLLIDEEGVVKITDFGLARLSREPGARVATRRSRGDTYMHFARLARDTPEITGGTEGFMAPEQKEGGAGDSRSDIYAVGVIARLLLTGRAEVANARPLHELYPEMDGEWDRIVSRCLAREPAARYADGAELLADLDALAGELDRVASRAPAWLWSLPVPVFALAVFSAMLALGGREGTPGAASAVATPVPARRSVREYGLKPADAELGYGLVCSGAPASISGWRLGSRAVWRREVPPGRYRVSAFYHYTSSLGSAPVRMAVRAGSGALSVYLPVSTSGEATSRAVLGEIEVTSSAGSVESELVEGPSGDTLLRLGPLVLEPLTSVAP